MAISLKHNFQSAIADGGDTSLVQPSNWNAEHNLTLATSRLIGRTTAGTGAAEEISVGTGLSLSAGSLTVGATTPQTDTTNTFTASQIISVTDNTNAALRITQLGTGEAIRVEDSTNPDSTAFVVDATGAVTTGGGITASGNISLPAATTESRFIEIGAGRSGNGYAFVDLIGDATYTDYGLRLIRGNGGANTTSQISHRGTGPLVISTTDAGAIDIYTNSTQRMYIRSDGGVGIGTAGAAGITLSVGKNITGAVTAYGIVSQATTQPDVTTASNYFYSAPSTAANAGTPYTIASINHYNATQGTFNADSTVSFQSGFLAANSLIGATTNYGFVAQNAAAVGAGKTNYNFYAANNIATGGGTTYGFYAAGTANNVMPNLSGGTAASSTLTLQSTTGAGTTDAIIFNTGSQSERMRINTSGNVGIGTTSPDGILHVNSFADAAANIAGVFSNGEGQGAISANTQSRIYISASGTPTTRGTYISGFNVDGSAAGNGHDLRFFVSDSNAAPTERFRFAKLGQLGIGGANYGTSGQVLTSGGASAAPSWSTPTASASGGMFWENDITLTSNYTITTNKNAMTAGPVTINSGVTVTVPSGSTWTIV